MNYDGVVTKLDSDLFLFLLDPDLNEIKDGINISEHECYKNMTHDQLMVVDVTFKDGTKVIDKIDLDEFIYGDTYGRHDVFIYIKDILLFSIRDQDNVFNIPIKEIIDDGNLNETAIDCIMNAKEAKKELEENV
jgi:hypothetical protein